ncbi:hypothetical protein BDV96DRAFT_598022 [Lophiotrema nucula]|uniref:Uncharacterized protein n=1 Tax=Lophiotrema nucula TaxID=690887 RepID=A0A6A5ZC71_9PLEO|nr:hypothetical protein BDV96DRAFT_598022 [Lophiotrema nucula]
MSTEYRASTPTSETSSVPTEMIDTYSTGDASQLFSDSDSDTHEGSGSDLALHADASDEAAEPDVTNTTQVHNGTALEGTPDEYTDEDFAYLSPSQVDRSSGVDPNFGNPNAMYEAEAEADWEDIEAIRAELEAVQAETGVARVKVLRLVTGGWDAEDEAIQAQVTALRVDRQLLELEHEGVDEDLGGAGPVPGLFVDDDPDSDDDNDKEDEEHEGIDGGKRVDARILAINEEDELADPDNNHNANSSFVLGFGIGLAVGLAVAAALLLTVVALAVVSRNEKAMELLETMIKIWERAGGSMLLDRLGRFGSLRDLRSVADLRRLERLVRANHVRDTLQRVRENQQLHCASWLPLSQRVCGYRVLVCPDISERAPVNVDARDPHAGAFVQVSKRSAYKSRSLQIIRYQLYRLLRTQRYLPTSQESNGQYKGQINSLPSPLPALMMSDNINKLFDDDSESNSEDFYNSAPHVPQAPGMNDGSSDTSQRMEDEVDHLRNRLRDRSTELPHLWAQIEKIRNENREYKKSQREASKTPESHGGFFEGYFDDAFPSAID